MTSTQYVPSPLADVQCHESNGRSTLVFVKEFKHSPEKVWQVLTKPEHHREWAPFESDRDLSSVGSAKLIMIDRDVEMNSMQTLFKAMNPACSNIPGARMYYAGNCKARQMVAA